jgi:hypothetical protein
VGVVQDTAGPSTGGTVNFWDHDDLATNTARMAPDLTCQLGDTSLSCEPDLVVDDGIKVIVPRVLKKPNTVRHFS